MASSDATSHRRKLRFESIDDALGEAERLVNAEHEGRLTQTGKWTLGQALGHLATWANFGFDGYPQSVRAPLPVRMILRAMRKRILNQGMMIGVKIRGVPGGTVGMEVQSTDEGARRFREAFERLGATCPTTANPVFGRMNHEQWIHLNLRHAELHLGFLRPE
jgi:hypothetical protein